MATGVTTVGAVGAGISSIPFPPNLGGSLLCGWREDLGLLTGLSGAKVANRLNVVVGVDAVGVVGVCWARWAPGNTTASSWGGAKWVGWAANGGSPV